ncbi:CoA-transferase family III domain-containing protein [Lactifluus volemus]|nr:CoA-transferase family III domain-containing protein [Lactifluus volemus]
MTWSERQALAKKRAEDKEAASRAAAAPLPVRRTRTFDHPQAIARGVVVEVEHPRAGKIKLLAPAVTYNGMKMPVTRPPPWLSEHTDEVLCELGYDTQHISQLREEGIV